ncbi:MAG: hypothetical protein KGL39_39065 [Patescibacteria group bacterium]|nr:hypothetical protein [Patescibacteria group bacterium]
MYTLFIANTWGQTELFDEHGKPVPGVMGFRFQADAITPGPITGILTYTARRLNPDYEPGAPTGRFMSGGTGQPPADEYSVQCRILTRRRAGVERWNG